jgi:predicted nucleic acid-binding protein
VWVVPDSNILFRDFALDGPQWRLVLDQARRGQFKLAVPEVVITETVNNYRRELKNAHVKLRSVVETQGGRLVELGITDLRLETEIDRDAAVAAYEGVLRRRLADAGAEILDVPDVKHAELIKRAVDQTQPFRDPDSGYRDTLIWWSVLALAADDDVALVSNDKPAFAGDEPDKLGRDLLHDLEVRKLAGDRVKLYPSLAPFIEAHVPANERIEHELRDRLRVDREFRENIRSEIEDLLSVYSFGPQDEVRLLARGDPRTASIEDVSIPDFEIDYVLGPEDGPYVVGLAAEVYGYINIRVPREALHDEEARGLAILEDDETQSHVLVNSDFEVEAQLVATYDPESRQFDDYDVIFASN